MGCLLTVLLLVLLGLGPFFVTAPLSVEAEPNPAPMVEASPSP